MSTVLFLLAMFRSAVDNEELKIVPHLSKRICFEIQTHSEGEGEGVLLALPRARVRVRGKAIAIAGRRGEGILVAVTTLQPPAARPG